ncbi:MAG: hypothetical protein R3A47_12205 [Polyangiales bacterium]
MEQPNPKERGYITVAARRPRYLEMAVDLALSLRATNPEPIAIVVCDELRAPLEKHYGDVFDYVLRLPNEYDLKRALKFSIGEVSPFQKNFFIDADAIVLESLEEWWNAVDGQTLSMMGELVGPDDDRQHHLESTTKMIARFGLEKYFKNNASVFYVDLESGAPWMYEAFEIYRDEILPGTKWPGDELAFGVLGGRHAIHSMLERSPIMWREQIESWQPGKHCAPVFSAIATPPEETVHWLVKQIAERRQNAGVAMRSEPMWRGKVAISGVPRSLWALLRVTYHRLGFRREEARWWRSV